MFLFNFVYVLPNELTKFLGFQAKEEGILTILLLGLLE